MPVKVEEQIGKFRLVEAETGELTAGPAGTPVDGAGHETREAAELQARAINARETMRASALAALQAGLPGILSDKQPGDATGGIVTLEVSLHESAGPYSGITAVPPGVLELVPAETLAGFRDSKELYWIPFGVRAEASVVREEHANLESTTEGTTPNESSPHVHRLLEGRTMTEIPSDARDDHIHPIDPQTGEIGETLGHKHARSQEFQAGGNDPAKPAPPIPPLGNSPTVQ